MRLWWVSNECCTQLGWAEGNGLLINALRDHEVVLDTIPGAKPVLRCQWPDQATVTRLSPIEAAVLMALARAKGPRRARDLHPVRACQIMRPDDLLRRMRRKIDRQTPDGGWTMIQTGWTSVGPQLWLWRPPVEWRWVMVAPVGTSGTSDLFELDLDEGS